MHIYIHNQFCLQFLILSYLSVTTLTMTQAVQPLVNSEQWKMNYEGCERQHLWRNISQSPDIYLPEKSHGTPPPSPPPPRLPSSLQNVNYMFCNRKLPETLKYETNKLGILCLVLHTDRHSKIYKKNIRYKVTVLKSGYVQ